MAQSRNVPCLYCSTKDNEVLAKLVTGGKIYPNRKDLDKYFFWHCDCGAYVGCHKAENLGDGTQPLGRLADARLRVAKGHAHIAFDTLWKKGTMSRTSAYTWLARAMNMSKEDAHIGMFDVEQCDRVQQLAARYRPAKNNKTSTKKRIPPMETATVITVQEQAAIDDFVETAKANDAKEIFTVAKTPNCGVYLKDGTDIPCLALYQDDLDHWVTLSKEDRMVRQYFYSEIL
jgi:hypothetical protein